MSRAARSLLSALAAAVCAVQAPAQVARCELQQAEAYVGQEILYQVLLRDVKEAKLEKAPAVEGLSIALDSEGVVNVSKNVVIFNGVRTERETGDYVFRFLVRADQPGAYRIPPPPITVEGRPVTGNAVVLRVEAASAQDLAFLEMRADRTEVVRGERFQLTADVFLKHLPAPAPTPDPLSQHDSGRSLFDAGTPPPSVKLPWVPQPPLGLGGFDLNAWATPLLNARRGLVLEPLERNRFQGEIADVDRKDAAGTTAKYRRYRFAVTLRAENVGKYALPAATLEGSLVEA